ncbi:DNA mismatch repair protein Mlh1 [Entomophthora muscae]|uniref:DNA mismatch repair protein Mlh1 n=1 Tax=Entomophthora muscae TaxID=34485 RepID=A0ACC2TI74_9FUNG|nr:DNA mismatch repair protein Mlh1 [Entomophthora muscae]
MFYNTPLRRKAFKSPNEEYQRILDVVNRYAVHCSGVAFSCKKQGSNFPDLITSSQASTVDKISQIYGRSLALELLEFKASSQEYKFQCRGYITHANYSARRLVFLLFINNRSVSSNALKKAIEGIYAPLLPKGCHPFIYLSLELPSKLVDVNVHPTKREVHFLYESEVIAEVAKAVQTHLEGSNNSRTFQAQALFTSGRGTTLLQPSRSLSALSSVKPEPSKDPTPRREVSFPSSLLLETPPRKNLDSSISSNQNTPARKQVSRYVRTDSQLQTLDSFYSPVKTPDLTRMNSRMPQTPTKPLSFAEKEASLLALAVDKPPPAAESPKPLSLPRRRRVEVRLTSVLELISEFKAASGDEIRSLIAKSTFVGCIDTKRAAIQHETKLYMINYKEIRLTHSYSLFYQAALVDFCNFPTIEINPPAPITRLVRLALGSKANVPPLATEFSAQPDPAVSLSNFLISRREMLEEYFLISIDSTGNLTKLPALIPKYCPPAHKLPQFLARLGSQVNWNDEKACFKGVCQELALFYQTDFIPSTPVQDKTKAYYHTIQHAVYPAMKRSLFPPTAWLAQETAPSSDDAICLLADLPDLYKVFERC